MTRVHRQIRITGAADGAKLRTAKLYGDDHLVVPVVALLGDAVVRPLNSRGPEFVPAEELARSTHQWAGRPVVPDHPHEGRSSANEPAVLETMGFGSTFNPRFEDGRLKLDAWLNLKRANVLGGDAQKVIERAQAGEVIEVSVGAWVSVLEAPGVSPSGQNYQFRWSEIDSDHLAMLPEGAEGACSVDMGCGAPRAAKSESKESTHGRAKGANAGAPPESQATASAGSTAAKGGSEMTKAPQSRGLLTRLFQGLGLRVAEHEEMSDVDLRGALADALRADEPGFEDIWEVKPLEGTVVYITFPADEPLFFRRSFEVSEEGEVALADDREQVEPVMRFEPVAASAEGEDSQDSEANRNDSEPVAAEGCGCENKQAKQGQLFRAAQDDDKTAAKAGKDGHMTKEDLVGRLIAAERSPFTEDDKKALEALSEERLQALEESFQEPEEPEEPEGEPQAVEPEPAPEPQAEPQEPAETVQLSKDEHARLLAATRAYEAEQERRKADLLAALKGKQDVYTEAELRAMSVEQLGKLIQLARVDEPVRDYSGRGLPVTTATKKATLPDAYGLGERFTH